MEVRQFPRAEAGVGGTKKLPREMVARGRGKDGRCKSETPPREGEQREGDRGYTVPVASHLPGRRL
jgi:hypothetical protein